MRVSKERERELIELIANNLTDALGAHDAFEYTKWDGLIECDELLTAEELQWVDANFRVQVRLLRK